MMTKLKHTAVLLAGVMVILLIVVWGIKHNLKSAETQPKPDPKTEAVSDESEAASAPQPDYDISSGIKLKEKDGVKTLKTDHFTLILSHGKSWDAKVNSKRSITVYNKALNKAKRGGELVTILAYDAGDESYVAGWSSGKDVKELKASLERIRSAADEMITGIDKSLEKQTKREQTRAARDEAR
jgi:hypothetical protein